MAWLGAQLKAQLKAAENLLEAVDRTVSTATGVVGPPAPRVSDSGLSTQGSAGDGGIPPAAQVPGASRLGDSPSKAGMAQQQHPFMPVATSSSLQAGIRTGPPPPLYNPPPPPPPPPLQQQQQVAGWQPASTSQIPFGLPAQGSIVSGAMGAPGTSFGPPQPSAAATPPSQPSSTGSFTIKQHGPFSPSPLKPQQQQQEDAAAPAPAPAPPAVQGFSLAADNPDAGLHSATAAGGPPSAGSSSSSSLQDRFSHFSQPPVASSGPASTNDSVNGFQIVGLPGQPAAAAAEQQATAGPAAAAEEHQQQQQPSSSQLLQDEHQHNVHQLESNAFVSSLAGTPEDPSTPDAATQAGDATEAEAAAAAAAEQQPAETVLHAALGETAPSAASDLPETFSGDAAATADESPAAANDPPAAQHAPQPVSAASGMLPAAAAAVAAAVAAAAAPVAAASGASFLAAAAAAAPGVDDAAGGASNSPSKSASSKEAQLTKLADTLRKRLDTVRAENQQLEDLLHAAEQRTAAELQRAQQLEAELAGMQREQDGIVASAAANAAAQDARIGRLQQEVEASNRQVTALQGALEAIQEQHQQVLSSKDSIEGGALEALRAELAAAESQLEAERRAHSTTKAAATNRERDLEAQLSSSSEALAVTQRQLQELSGRMRELEEQQLLATAEAAKLKEQVRQLNEQQAQPQQVDPSQLLQLEAEREGLQVRLNETATQLQAATQAQRTAEAQVATLQQEIAHLHSSYASSPASRGPPQLEQQVGELQELLYQKQQQLERLSGEKQAQQLMLERQITSLKQELGRVHAAAAAAQTSSSGRVGGHDIIPMDALGEPYQRLARHNKLGGAVQAAANLLDTTAASASQLLRQQPLARLIVFLYVVLIHLYVYFLLARMQKQALQLMAGQEKTLGIGPH